MKGWLKKGSKQKGLFFSYLRPTNRDSIKWLNNPRSWVAAADPMDSASFKSSSGKSKLLVNAANVYLPLANKKVGYTKFKVDMWF